MYAAAGVELWQSEGDFEEPARASPGPFQAAATAALGVLAAAVVLQPDAALAYLVISSPAGTRAFKKT